MEISISLLFSMIIQGYSWVHFLKSKDQVYNTFLKWYKRIHNIFNSTIKFIRTDNGTEFVNRYFNNFCTENGIIHQFTVPHNETLILQRHY